MLLHTWQGQKQIGLYPLIILCRRTEREKWVVLAMAF